MSPPQTTILLRSCDVDLGQSVQDPACRAGSRQDYRFGMSQAARKVHTSRVAHLDWGGEAGREDVSGQVGRLGQHLACATGCQQDHLLHEVLPFPAHAAHVARAQGLRLLHPHPYAGVKRKRATPDQCSRLTVPKVQGHASCAPHMLRPQLQRLALDCYLYNIKCVAFRRAAHRPCQKSGRACAGREAPVSAAQQRPGRS